MDSMDLKWLKQCRLYFETEKSALLFIGNKKSPRSTVLSISNEISAPINYPSTPLVHLDEMFNNDISMENNHLQEEFQFLLSLLLQVKLNKFLSNNEFYYDDTLLKWVDNSIESPEIKKLVTILSAKTYKTRQNALYRLVEMNTNTSHILLRSLIPSRDEIMIAILRELGRWNISIPSILFFIKNHKTGNKVVNRYIAYSLHPQNNGIPEELKQELLNHSLQLVTTISSTKPTMKHIQKNPKTAYLGLVYLSCEIPDLYSRLLLNFYEISSSGRVKRTSLMRMMKHAEMLQNPILVGGILALTLTGKSVFLGRNEQIIQASKNEKCMIYVRQRVFSLLNIWDKTGRTDMVDKTLIFLLSNIPRELSKYKKLRYKYIKEDAWVSDHPVLSRYELRISLLLHNNVDLLKKVIYHLSRNENLLFFTWILRNIDSELLKTLISELDFNEKLYLYTAPYSFDPEFNLFYYIKKGRKKYNSLDFDFIPTRANIKKTLNFFYRLKFNFPESIYSKLIGWMHEDFFVGKNLHDLFIKYLQKVVAINDAKSSLQLANMLKQSIIATKHRNCKKCVYKLEFLSNWDKYTSHVLPENWGDEITGIKIAHYDLLKNIGIDAISKISIKTITTSYEVLEGEIHHIIEGNIQFALKRYNWDQLAKHYLALGLRRPKREELIKSELRKIPSLLLKDQLGRIALVTQTINYCIENGFTPSLENVITSNIYMRGWNIDNSMENKIQGLLGSVGMKLRSYLAAYLILEKSDVNDELLLLAREVDMKVIRDRILRTLERFGAFNMWFMLSGSTYEDLSLVAIEQLKRLRMAKEEKIQLIQRMLNAEDPDLRILGAEWMLNIEFTEEDTLPVFSTAYEDVWVSILTYFKMHQQRLLEQDPNCYHIFSALLWSPSIAKKTNLQTLSLYAKLKDPKGDVAEISSSSISDRASKAIQCLAGGDGD